MRTASTGVRLTEIEGERIRLNARGCSAASLSILMGRDPHTVAAWARVNGVTFGRVPGMPAPRYSRKSLKRHRSAKIERMMTLAYRGPAKAAEPVTEAI